MVQPQQRNTIEGEPLDDDVLLDFATIDIEDIESAILWWNEHASDEWIDALDSEASDG